MSNTPGIRRKPNGRWQVRYYDPAGRRRAKEFVRKIDAKAFKDGVETDKRRGTWIDPAKGRHRFTDYARTFEERRQRVRRLGGSARLRDTSLLNNHVLPYFGGMVLGEVHRVHVQDFVDQLLKRDYAPDTVRRCYEMLARVFEDAVENEFIGRSPCRSIDLPPLEKKKPQRILTPQEVNALAEAIDPRYRALVLLGAYGGLRIGEMAAIRASDIDLSGRMLLVDEGVREPGGHLEIGRPKTKASERRITLSPFLADVLADHIDRYPAADDSEFLFAGEHGGTLRPNNLRKRAWAKAVAASVGLPCTPHDLRHTHETWMAQAGIHPKVMQGRSGHKDSRTTLDVYTRYQPGMDAVAADAMEAIYQKSAANGDQMGTKGATPRR